MRYRHWIPAYAGMTSKNIVINPRSRFVIEAIDRDPRLREASTDDEATAMRVRAYILLGILFLLCLTLDALTFGALAREPMIGPAVDASARTEAPLTYTYIVLGTLLTGALPPLQSAGSACADAAFGNAYPSIAATPSAAIDLLFSESRGATHALFMLFYWGAPVLLVLTIVAWLLRTRPTHLIKAARR